MNIEDLRSACGASILKKMERSDNHNSSIFNLQF